MVFCSPRDLSERRTGGVLVGGGVSVGTGVGVLVDSGVSVGTGVEMVGMGLAAHPLIAKMTRPRSAIRKHPLSSVFCILITSQPDSREAGIQDARGRCITDTDLKELVRRGKWLSGQ